jgi:ArsR family transcriptional regulator
METANAILALAALAQETRLAIVRMLISLGPPGLAATKISEELDVPASSMSFHLKELSHAGLITPRQAGRFIIYSANFNTMNALLAFLTENCCDGAPCTVSPQPACRAAVSPT